MLEPGSMAVIQSASRFAKTCSKHIRTALGIALLGEMNYLKESWPLFHLHEGTLGCQSPAVAKMGAPSMSIRVVPSGRYATLPTWLMRSSTD